MSRSALSEQVNRLLPGEKWKRVREAILQSATYSGQRLDTLRRNIDQENRLKDGKLQDGTLEFPISTTAELNLFVWVINYQIFQPGFTSLPVLAHDPDFPRPDVFTGDATGTIKYYPGTIDSEGNGQFPDIPEGEVLLREVIRNTDGSNDSTPGNGNGNGKYVSLNDTGTQVVKSYLGSEPLAASLRDSLYPDANGVFRKTRVDYHGVYSTVEGVGATDWSKIVTINVAGGQLRYFVMLEFAGVSPAMEKGMVWIQFETDGAGDLTVNKLKVFGEINPAKLKMVKLDANTYAVFVHHNESGAFFKFRPQFSFGGSTVYTYHHQEGKASIPAGTLYEFEQYSDNPFTEDEIASIQNSEAPAALNPVVTVSKLNSYAYVQEAPTTGSHYARKDGIWVAFTPFTVAGTPTDGHVVTSVAGVPTWVAPSGGGGGNFIAYDTAQGLSGSQRQQALHNIGASAGSVETFNNSGVTTVNNLTITKSFIEFRGSSTVTLTGIVALWVGQEITLYNETNNDLTISGGSGLSSGLNQIVNGTVIPNRSAIKLKYVDYGGQQRWIITGHAFFYNQNGVGIFTKRFTGIGGEAVNAVGLNIYTTSTVGLRITDSAGSVRIFETQSDRIRSNVAHGFGDINPTTSIAVNMKPFGNNIVFRSYDFGGTRQVDFMGNGNWQSKGGAIFGGADTGNVPLGRVEIRGAGTGVGNTLLLRNSASTNQFIFRDNGQLFMYNITASIPTAGTKEVYVDASGFLKLAI